MGDDGELAIIREVTKDNEVIWNHQGRYTIGNGRGIGALSLTPILNEKALSTELKSLLEVGIIPVPRQQENERFIYYLPGLSQAFFMSYGVRFLKIDGPPPADKLPEVFYYDREGCIDILPSKLLYSKPSTERNASKNIRGMWYHLNPLKDECPT